MTIAVQTYAYKGRNAEGKVVSGKIEDKDLRYKTRNLKFCPYFIMLV